MAPTVEYFSYPGAGGKFFRCTEYRATLSTTACAARWKESQSAVGYAAARVEKCRTCAIGAVHAGKPAVSYSSLYGKSVCPRCGKYSGRIINGTRCVSCYNREREFTSGKNAKGTIPTMSPLLPRSVRYSVENGPVLIYSSPLCADTLELMMAVLRTTRGRAQFGFHGRTAARQGTLFYLRTVRHRRQPLPRRATHGAALAAGMMWLLDTPKIEMAAVANG